MSPRTRRHVFTVVAVLVSVPLATSLVVALLGAGNREIPTIETPLILPLVI